MAKAMSIVTKREGVSGIAQSSWLRRIVFYTLLLMLWPVPTSYPVEPATSRHWLRHITCYRSDTWFASRSQPTTRTGSWLLDLGIAGIAEWMLA
jgi:hypothetical protein